MKNTLRDAAPLFVVPCCVVIGCLLNCTAGLWLIVLSPAIMLLTCHYGGES